MPVRPLVRLSVAAVVALSLVACGGDDSTDAADSTTTEAGDTTTTEADDGAAVDGELSAEELAWIAGAMKTFDVEEQDGLTVADGRCVATAVVKELGIDRLDELGITPEGFNDADLPPLEADEADAVVDRIATCMDLRGLMLAGFNEGGDLSPEAKACLEDAVTDELAHDLMAASIRGDEDALVGSAISDAISGCPGFESLN
jgi:hypothetical protein